MKAVLCARYGPPEILEIKEIRKPVPKDNEVLVKVHATTVTVADTRVRSFTVPLSFWIPARLILGITKPKKPILGVEFSGEIESVGKDVQRFKKGDRILGTCLSTFGAYAEYKCISEDGVIAIKPENITHEEAAALPVGARTALHYLRQANIQPGNKILIYGASGSVGTYAVQLAKYFGAEVTAVCSAANFDLMNSIGADQVLDYTDLNFITKLQKYDVFFVAIDKIDFSICNNALKENGVYLNVTTPVKSLSMLWMGTKTKKKIIVGHNPPEKAEDLIFLFESHYRQEIFIGSDCRGSSVC
jgi:NADPH:quinone reductase-like Zn-dependent oxidoreductase